MNLRTLPFWLVDVFAREPLSGNGLSVFLLDDELPTLAMQRITQEMRQFETIFLARIGGNIEIPCSHLHHGRGASVCRAPSHRCRSAAARRALFSGRISPLRICNARPEHPRDESARK